ncbi:putative nuclease HARBI1 [Lineus longissimus]|uniref:putative nuclease HARBI1 n=1 Tax=Lineus longissimus TaxID=88925 RepID=UPI00315C8090
MWRVAADAFFGNGDNVEQTRNFRQRINPFEDFDDDNFFRKYRFPKPIFTELLDILEPALERNTHRSHVLDSSLQLCTAVRYFAQGGFLPMVGDVHGIGPRVTSKCIHTVAQAICDRMDRFIRWPTVDEIGIAKRQFYERFQFPCIVGLIDGSQVPIQGPFPPANEAVYICRKGFHSINVQIVCDMNLNIIDLDARWPGSTHDSFILRNSHIWDMFEQGRVIPNTWLLGDSGYPQKPWLMTPYQNPANDAQERYNTQHKHIRSIVERCNGVWKMRWRCLTKPNMFQPAKASKIIAACGALHNFAVAHGIPIGEEIDEDLINQQHDDPNHDPEPNVGNDGARAREDLVRRVFTRRQ